MTYELTAYLIYLGITYYITVHLGWVCYKNGLVFIQSILQDELQAEALNKLLLVGYYLVNLGYLAMSIHYWEAVENGLALVLQITRKVGVIVLLLAVLHYTNMFVISTFGKKLLAT